MSEYLELSGTFFDTLTIRMVT